MSSSVGKAMWYQLFKLNAEKPQSLQAQLREMLVKAILDEKIPLDSPLPSTRELSKQLGVARNTVVLAYQHLIDDHYLIAVERRGYFVNAEILAGRVSLPANSGLSHHHDEPNNEAPYSALPTGQLNTALEGMSQRSHWRPHDWQSYPYPFIYGQVDPSLFPVNDWREACRMALRVGAIEQWMHDQVDHDDELLVEQILTRILPRRGVWAKSDEILITSGAQNALFLIAQLLLNSESVVGLEDPCYIDARNIFGLFSAKKVAFPVGDEGVITDQRLSQCRLMYVTPSHQCPTTRTMPLAARQKLLNDAAQHDVIIVEDDYESELNFVGEPTPALKSLDNSHRVIYVGSLSKTLAPGLRVGFMVGPPEFISKARALRRLMYRHPPTNNQRTVGYFLALGHHDSALLRLSQAFKRRWEIMDKALASHTPLSALAPSFGGSSFWVQLPESVQAQQLECKAASGGIVISAGDAYFDSPNGPKHFCRLGFSSIHESKIEAGIKRLSSIICTL